MHTYTCSHVHAFSCSDTRTDLRRYAALVHTIKHTHTHTYTRVHTHINTRTRTRTHAHTNTNTNTHTRTHTHAHTHTHTHTHNTHSSCTRGSDLEKFWSPPPLVTPYVAHVSPWSHGSYPQLSPSLSPPLLSTRPYSIISFPAICVLCALLLFSRVCAS